MAQAAPLMTVRGPTFIRLLARLAEINVAAPRQALPERLGHWLDWKHALSLAAALDGQADQPATAASTSGDLRAECAQAREVLATAIRDEPLLAPGAPTPAEPDYAAFRQLCLTRQRALQATTGRLRGKLRDALASAGIPHHPDATIPANAEIKDGNAFAGDSPMAQLAEVDAVMEAVLSPREHALLAKLPDLLAQRFERLRAAAPSSPTWLDGFRRDMQSVLLGELDLRFQPIEALLAALRTP